MRNPLRDKNEGVRIGEGGWTTLVTMDFYPEGH